jgi:uncharacterized membrane protein YqhA
VNLEEKINSLEKRIEILERKEKRRMIFKIISTVVGLLLFIVIISIYMYFINKTLGSFGI